MSGDSCLTAGGAGGDTCAALRDNLCEAIWASQFGEGRCSIREGEMTYKSVSEILRRNRQDMQRRAVLRLCGFEEGIWRYMTERIGRA
jgi:hypothetical protein